jgi:hypothetical protein
MSNLGIVIWCVTICQSRLYYVLRTTRKNGEAVSTSHRWHGIQYVPTYIQVPAQEASSSFTINVAQRKKTRVLHPSPSLLLIYACYNTFSVCSTTQRSVASLSLSSLTHRYLSFSLVGHVGVGDRLMHDRNVSINFDTVLTKSKF